MKTLEAAHHKLQRRLLGITRYDEVSDVEVRKKNRTDKARTKIAERRLGRLGPEIRMDDCRIPNQALNWNISSANRKLGDRGKTRGTLFGRI